MNKNNINIGDYLICKRDYLFHKIFIHDGKKYKVTNIETTIEYDYLYIIDDNNNPIEIQNPSEDFDYYFYNENEIRKIKLNYLKML